jgi:hypothetical protein
VARLAAIVDTRRAVRDGTRSGVLEGTTAPTVADRLRSARGRRFVGRQAELELVAAALEEPEPPFAVAFVHGPGGVGKSALLGAIETLARSAGAAVARVDLRSIEPSPPQLAAALGDALGAPGRSVLLLDTYEPAGALDGWLRDELVPALPAGSLVVIAGRAPPGPAWTSDPGWRALLRVVSLRNLAPGDVAALLRAEGVPDALHERLGALTHGHPLALTLLVDVLRQGAPEPAGLGDAPDVVRALLERFLVEVPDARHRRALDVCAYARTTTEDLLRAALEADASALFAWLRSLSFVEEGSRGVFPHDLVRDALGADLRWRDPEAHAELRRRVHDHIVGRLARGGDQQAAGDLVFLHRDNPFTARFWDWDGFGEAYADGLRPGDRDALLAMTERHEGAASAALAAHWLDRQPHAFTVFRGGGGRRIGYTAVLALHEADPGDIAADPGAAAMWAYAQRHAPPRPGEEVHAARFFMDADAYQAPGSPSLNVLTIASTQRWLSRRRPGWELIGALTDPEVIGPLMAYIAFDRLPDADYEAGGLRHAVFGHDWRRMDPARWLAVMGEREAAAGFEPVAAGTAAAPVVALSQPEFREAVRRALRDLHRPDALAANPLARSRAVADRGPGEPPAEVLEALVREAVASLGRDPRDELPARVLDRTYLRPAPTQERAAELLGLPSSTYRRHLARAVERVADWLWQRELYGAG